MENKKQKKQLTRRDLMRLGLGATAGIWAASTADAAYVCTTAAETPILNVDSAVNVACGVGLEQFPYSPFILQPFTEAMTIPTPLAPGYRPSANPGAPALGDWTVRVNDGALKALGELSVPGPGVGDQDALGDRPNGVGLPRAGTHQMYPGVGTRWDGRHNVVENYPAPLLYHIRLQVAQHRVTNSAVVPLAVKKNGTVGPVALPALATDNGNILSSVGTDTVLKSNLPTYQLPMTTIQAFNGTFPGPMINAEYGKPTLVRFENDLDYNPNCYPRYDYGAPDWAFLTHLHNGHTAPESDGNPHHMTEHGGGYQPGEWCDNLYLHYPAGGDDREKQSFLWFHDHRMHHTGANVYKGMVGLMPLYDPDIDNGDETKGGGLGLPGVRTNNLVPDGLGGFVPDGTFSVEYDVPMAFYDCVMDDGVTPHFDMHQSVASCGLTHPEWWGQHFFRHYPGSGFVGDVFTVNGVAFPTMEVKRRKYRFRFLDASIARIYDLSLRRAPAVDVGTGIEGVAPFPGMQGQWNFATAVKKGKNTTVSKAPGTVLTNTMLQIASEGGLLDHAIYRDSIQIWPAKRREVVIDFSQFNEGETLYLVNSLQMLDGKKPLFPPPPGVRPEKGFDPNYAVPLVQFKIGAAAPDNSDTMANLSTKTLRQLPGLSNNIAAQPTFSLTSGNPLNPTGVGAAETKWLINDLEFDANQPLHVVTEDSPELWTLNNLGGGWVHPFHIHQEEHKVLARSGSTNTHPEDTLGREDVVALDPGESVQIYRNFRTFCGKYVAHCHNLAHEDHNMMFGWTIQPKP